MSLLKTYEVPGMSSLTILPNQPESALANYQPEQRPHLVYLARLSEGSRRSQSKACETVARMASGDRAGAESFPWAALRYEHVQALRTALKERYAPATVNKHLAAIRGVLKEAWRLGLIGAEEYHRAVDVESVKSQTMLRGRALESNEVGALAHVCQKDRTARGARDAAILALGYAGLRRAEIVGLDLSDYEIEAGTVTVRRGKGAKDRPVDVAGGVVDALRAWLDVRGEASGPFLYPIRKGGKVEPGRLSTQAIYRVCARLASEAGVREFTPHDLRRTCTSTLLDAGVDLSTVAAILGHASTDTTRRYDRAPERRRKQAAERLVFPYSYRR